MPKPLYTATNCHGAYQLNWTLSVFWREPIASAPWLDPLKQATEPEGVRILEHRLSDPSVSQFFLASVPSNATWSSGTSPTNSATIEWPTRRCKSGFVFYKDQVNLPRIWGIAVPSRRPG